MSKELIYEIPNPCWLSDTFIFTKVKDKESSLYDKTVFVKVNCDNKIEEIGVGIEIRMHNIPFDKLMEKSHEATMSHKRSFLKIDMLFFASAYDYYKERGR